MAYQAFNEKQAVEYARSNVRFFSADSELECREIGDGNLNLVFIIRDRQSGKSVILKQALPYAKVVGESWPLTLDRARIESEALAYQYGKVPQLVPELYAYDQELALTVMEDLSDHVIMRKGLIECNHYPLFADHITDFLAHTLFFSSDFGMDQQAKKRMVEQFINPELCKITEDLIFDHPFRDADTNQISAELRPTVELLWQDESLKAEAALLRELFLTKAEALLHGDLHTGSIFVKENSTKVIDPEFAFCGPIGFDVGAVVGNLLLNYAGQQFWSRTDGERADYRSTLLKTIADIFRLFEEKFSRLWTANSTDEMFRSTAYRQAYLQRLFGQAIGFAGCVIIRRVVGLAKVADIETISDSKIKLQAQQFALAIGSTLVRNHRNIRSIEELVSIIQTTEG